MIDLNKVLTLFLFTVIGGLFHILILGIMLLLLNEENWAFKIEQFNQIMKSGGLFFFSTSVLFSSFFSLLTHYDFRLIPKHLNFTLIMCAALVPVTIISYVFILADNFGVIQPDFFQDISIYPQIACSLIALVYAFFVASVTGILRKAENGDTVAI